MSYIVYHEASTMIYKTFDNKTSAKRSCTCANRMSVKHGLGQPYAWTTSTNYYENVVHKVTVKSLMTGQDVEIDSNTPWCCNPASEAFWSM